MEDKAGQADLLSHADVFPAEMLCPWCSDVYSSPKQLSCSHSLCERCVEELLCFSILQSFEVCTSKISVDFTGIDPSQEDQSQHSTIEEVVCPTCKKPTVVTDYTSFVDSLPRNNSLSSACSQLMERKSSKKCDWCEKEAASTECSKCEVLYCSSCKDETHSRPAFANHQFYDIGELDKQRAKTCQKHKGRRKDLFCCDCSLSLCLYCTKYESEHKNHQLCSFPEANKQLHKEIEKMLSRFEYSTQDLHVFHDTVASSARTLEEGQIEVEKEIKQHFEAAHALLKESEKKIMRVVKKRTEGDLRLAKVIEESTGAIKQSSQKIVAAYPKEALDPSYLIQYKKMLSSTQSRMENIHMETSLFPVRFDFDMKMFSESLAKICSLSEHLDVTKMESCIASEEQTKLIIKWLSRTLSGRKECNLVYRASHNGWSDIKFQEICDKLSDPIVVIGKTDSGHLFGGFQTVPFKKGVNANSFMGKDSFLFSLGDGKGRSPVQVANKLFDELKHFQYSPKDLRFQLNNKLVVSQLGNSFQVPEEMTESTFMLGSPQGVLVELELFCIGDIHVKGPKVKEILRGQLQMKQTLSKMMGQPYHPSNLLYKASRDGWFPSLFHELCDDKGPTMVLAKSEHGYIFGGFSAQDWGCRSLSFGGYIQDPKAFLFSLGDGKGRKPSLLPVKHPKSAMQYNSKAGPCFGAGNDLRISLKDQTVQCNPHSYVIPSGFRQDTYLAGQASCRLDEVEIYSVPLVVKK